MILDRLGPEVLQWDPETITMEIEQALGVKLPPANFNKLMGAIELVTSDSFYNSLPDFIRLCNVLYNGTLSAEDFDPADAAEIAWGVTEALLIWPPDVNEQEPFDAKIIQYIDKALKDEGIMVPPDILRLGTSDSSLWKQVQHDFSDDPGMFAAIFSIEQGKTGDIDIMVKARLRLLLRQLSELDLYNGDAANAVQNMLAALQRSEQKGKQLRSAT